MNNCPTCGVPLSDTDAFCPNCGAATGKPSIESPKTVMDIQPMPAQPVMMQQPVQPVQPVMTQQPMPAQPVMPQPMPQQPMQPAMAQPMPQQPMQPGVAPMPMDWQQQVAMRNRAQNNSYATAVKVMMVIGCVIGATYYLIPLLWCVPMTVVAWKKLDRGEPLGTAFKVCTCIFVSRLAGFFMFMMKDEVPRYYGN